MELRPARLWKLAKFLDTLPPEKFDFLRIVSKSREGCGTVCCAIGWMPVVFPKNCKWVTDPGFPSGFAIITEGEYCIEGVLPFFGITLTEAKLLFVPRDDVQGHYPWGIRVLGPRALPQEVARSIRAFVQWKKEGNELSVRPVEEGRERTATPITKAQAAIKHHEALAQNHMLQGWQTAVSAALARILTLLVMILTKKEES